MRRLQNFRIIRVSIIIALTLYCARLVIGTGNISVCEEFTTYPAVLIAHAGGGLSAGTYSNSLEAVGQSLKNNFRLIELDFDLTEDGKLVVIHDWQETLRYWYDIPFTIWIGTYFEGRRLASSTFEAFPMRSGINRLTVEGLKSLLEQHPLLQVVIDTKGDTLQALKLLAEALPDFRQRIIPEIYDISEHSVVTELGYPPPIFAIYRSTLPNEKIVEFTKSHKLFAVAMPIERAEGGLSGMLSVRSAVHTVNTAVMARRLENLGVDIFYSDCLIPQH